MVDYGALPPEINSARIYAGPGAGSLIAAEAAWAALAAELAAAAEGHRSVISGLTSGPWLGPAAASLIAATTPFVAWLQSSAEEAELASYQAGSAAAAYEAAFAATVPPPVVAANRALLAALVATNFLGQNTPAIATAEAEYLEFWAQDAGAMYGYAGSAAAATTLTDFADPAEVADPIGLLDQAIAVFKAEETAALRNWNSATSGVTSRVTDMLRFLSAPIQSTAIDQWLMAHTPLDDVVAIFSKYLAPYVSTMQSSIQSIQSFGQVSNGVVAMSTFAKAAAPAAKALEGAASAAASAASNAAPALPNIGGVAAALGKAAPIGALSAPASWTTTQAVTNPLGALASNAAAIPAEANLNALPMAPMGGVGAGRYGRILPAYGFKPSIMARPPAAG